jgi:hypothetical protein
VSDVVIAIIAAVGISTLVLGLIAVLMYRAGLSLRPIVFMAVLLVIVGGPQIAFHLSQEMGWIPARDFTWVPEGDRGAVYGFAEQESVTAVSNGKFVHTRQLFGRDADPTLITDLLAIPGGPFTGAEAAQMATVPPAGTVVAARFPTEQQAKNAGMAYIGQATGVASPPGQNGMWTVQRPVGDVVVGVAAGRTVLFASGASTEEAMARLDATGAFVANDASSTVSPEARSFWLYQPIVLGAIVLLITVAAVGWFFRGTSWAATTEPKPDIAAASESELRRRLLAVNGVEVPYKVTEGDRGRIAISYRFGDARWVDLARAHGLSRTHRILLEFDESNHTVRPTEQFSRLDWSAGANGGSVQWSTATGIVFFQKEYTKVYGLQITREGKITPQLSYEYDFDLQEMKAPFIQAVTGAGWRWRPVIWHAPAALRWLTG